MPEYFISTKKLQLRYLARSILVITSLALNSWAIASFVPHDKQNSTHTRLATGNINLSFARKDETDMAQSDANIETNSRQAKKIEATTQVTDSSAILKSQHPPTPKAVSKAKSKTITKTTQPIETTTPIEQPVKQLAQLDSHVPDNAAENTAENRVSVATHSAQKALEDTGIEVEMADSSYQPPLISNPSFAKRPKPPRYPMIARKRGQQGTVWLEVWLDDAGQQIKRSVTSSSGTSSLDKAALEAASHWEFQPYTQADNAIASRVHIPVEFVLN